MSLCPYRHAHVTIRPIMRRITNVNPQETCLSETLTYVFVTLQDVGMSFIKYLMLWLAERSVCMRVCKHGCGVEMFCFSRANHAITNLKKLSSSKLDKFTLFTHSFVGWNLENRYKEGVSIFLRLSWHFKREKSVFCKASFCKTRTDYACKTSWTRFATGNNFSFNQCHNKEFCVFSQESYFIKAKENFFSVFA